MLEILHVLLIIIISFILIVICGYISLIIVLLLQKLFIWMILKNPNTKYQIKNKSKR